MIRDSVKNVPHSWSQTRVCKGVFTGAFPVWEWGISGIHLILTTHKCTYMHIRRLSSIKVVAYWPCTQSGANADVHSDQTHETPAGARAETHPTDKHMCACSESMHTQTEWLSMTGGAWCCFLTRITARWSSSFSCGGGPHSFEATWRRAGFPVKQMLQRSAAEGSHQPREEMQRNLHPDAEQPHQNHHPQIQWNLMWRMWQAYLKRRLRNREDERIILSREHWRPKIE